jgi:hypothetical protein
MSCFLDAVFEVVVSFEGQAEPSRATAFAVGPKRLLTAWHVLTSKAGIIATIKVGLPNYAGQITAEGSHTTPEWEVRCVWPQVVGTGYNADHQSTKKPKFDVAVLELTQGLLPDNLIAFPVNTWINEAPTKAFRFRLAGYSQAAEDFVKSVNQQAATAATQRKAERLEMVNGRCVGCTSTSKEVRLRASDLSNKKRDNAGLSGSPVEVDGQLMGIVFHFDTKHAGGGEVGTVSVHPIWKIRDADGFLDCLNRLARFWDR